MNKFIKYAIIGMGGYLIGHFEMKYKLVKLILADKLEKESKQKEEEVEAQ